MKNAFTFLCWLLATAGLAQSGGSFSLRYDSAPTVSVYGRTLLNPWAGGLNATQYSTLRLNDDARDDLVVFDRTTGKVSTFVAVAGSAGGLTWQYAPEYEMAFPSVSSWMLLVDYDGDGRKDLFTNTSSNIRVYHHELQNGRVSFRLVADPLMTEGLSGPLRLYVSSTDVPAITDYDDDGDVDIIAIASGGSLTAYYQNFSVERTGKKDGLDYQRMGGLCWGHFSDDYCNHFTFGLECDAGSGRLDPNPTPAVVRPSGARPMHAGTTLLVLDADGDAKKDLLMGFVSCENIVRVRNAGTNDAGANFVSFDSLYPAQTPILFPAFPAAFWEDVDGDGQKDLLASPNLDRNENNAFNFRASGWFYKNAGTNQKPDFRLVQKDFLQADMLDLGENAAPALTDLDGDGDVDLLVGYRGDGTGSDYRAGLWHFDNRGTPQQPAFVLETMDYFRLSSLNLRDLVPSFADVDANGGIDLLLTGTNGREREVRVLLNESGRGEAVRYSPYNPAGVRRLTLAGIAPGDLLTLADVDRDGKPDALVSKESDGTIQYARNVGTASNPTFGSGQNFGGFQTDASSRARARSLVAVDMNGDRLNELLLADTEGRVRLYRFPDRADQSLTLLDSLPGIGLPGTQLVAAAADLDGDQLPDLLLGSRAGGLRYLKNTSAKVVVTGLTEEPTGPWAFPNPTDRYLTVRPPHDGQLALVSLAGQLVVPGRPVRARVDAVVDLGNVPAGLYLLRLTADDPARPVWVQKVIVGK